MMIMLSAFPAQWYEKLLSEQLGFDLTGFI